MKEVYDLVDARLKDIPNRREVKLWVGLCLVGGQTVASLLTAYVTHLTPPQQALAILHFFI